MTNEDDDGFESETSDSAPSLILLLLGVAIVGLVGYVIINAMLSPRLVSPLAPHYVESRYR